jgi:hypothetical protein
LEIGKNLILFGGRRNFKYYLEIGKNLILFGDRKKFNTIWR